MDFFIEKAKEQQMDFGKLEVGQANIKVIGSGGSGNNMVTWLYKRGIKGAEILACNTDTQHLKISEADKKFLIGKDVTRGLGCGGFPQKGRDSALESSHELKEYMKKSDMVFVCAGMGGGTGTGSAPVIAQIAKDQGAIVVGVVTMPFTIERARLEKAEIGLTALRKYTDTVIAIDNNRLVKIAGNLPIQQAFSVANELISTMIKGIVETISTPSLVNLDFADVHAIMTNGGLAAIGVGTSDTNNRVEEAVRGALHNPLLDVDYRGATGALIHVWGGPDLLLDEINRVGELVVDGLDEDANVIWGARITEDMKGKLMVMSIVTGVNAPFHYAKKATPSAGAQEFNEQLGIEIIRD